MKLHATNKDVIIKESERLISGSVKIYNCEFTFDESWDGFAKTVVFSTNGSRLINMALVDNTCEIPVEVLRPNARIRIGVYGTDGVRSRPTTYSEWINVEQGADVSGNYAEPPTPSVFDQWVAGIDQKHEAWNEQEQARVEAENARVEAEQKREDLETGYVAQAKAYAESAKASEATVEANKNATDVAKVSAENSAISAAQNAAIAQNSATNTLDYSNNAAYSAVRAKTSETNAQSSASTAVTKAAEAEVSATVAQVARTDLEIARDAAAASAESAAKSAQEAKDATDFATRPEAQGYANTAVSNHNKATDAHEDIRSAVQSAEQKAVSDANKYTDQRIAAIPTPDVSGQINAHNANTSAHSDIRTAVSNAQTAANSATSVANTKVAKTDIVQSIGAATDKVMSQKAVTEAIGYPPSYWLDELDTKADAIRLAMETAGKNKSAFLWYTDSHWTYGNSKVSPKLLRYLWKHTPMNKVNFGGDIVVNKQERKNMAYLYAEWRSAIRGLPNHHSVVGNHDVMVDYPYAFLIAPEESADMVMGGDLYYYIDNPCEQTRYIYLDTGRQSGSDEEVAWLIGVLNSVLRGWRIVVISHVWFQYTSSSAPTVGRIPEYAQKVLNLLDAYNAKGSGSITMVSTACEYDFSNAVGAVEFCIGGHIHVDYDFTSSGGIPVILTASDTNQERSSDETEDSGTMGTITESAVFGIVANYETREVSVVGVGRGGSRTVALRPVGVKYINQIPISKDTNGSVYNVIGYADDTRLNSSGATQAATSTYTGLDCTGFIPVKVGDVVRMQGMETRADSSLAASSRFCFYDASKTFIALQTLNNLGAETSAEQYNTVTDADGYLTQFTVPSKIINTDISAVAYMRVSVVGITEDSIITINEPIA